MDSNHLKALLTKEFILWRRDWKRGMCELISPIISIAAIIIVNLVLPPTTFGENDYAGYEFPFGFSQDSEFADQIRVNSSFVDYNMENCYFNTIGIVGAGKYENYLKESLSLCTFLIR